MGKPTSLEDIAGQLAFIVEHMAMKDETASKDDVARVETYLSGIETELRSIRSELRELRGMVENMEGYRKEIDHALDRIAAIEKHLGIERKIAA